MRKWKAASDSILLVWAITQLYFAFCALYWESDACKQEGKERPFRKAIDRTRTILLQIGIGIPTYEEVRDELETRSVDG